MATVNPKFTESEAFAVSEALTAAIDAAREKVTNSGPGLDRSFARQRLNALAAARIALGDAFGDYDVNSMPEALTPSKDPVHTVRGGKDATDERYGGYGVTHDMDCPGCVESGSSFTASPRSETYWAS